MNNRADRISRKADGEFTPEERQELRFLLDKLLYNGLSIDDLAETQRKAHDLWWVIGWIPMTARNWKAIMVALALALLIGGRTLIENITTKLGGLL